MSIPILAKTLQIFRAGRDIEHGDAEPVLDALITERNEKILSSVFHAWDRKGIAEDEIYSIAKIMRDRCIKVNSRHTTFVDIVGTGGSRAKTFNVSTAAAFVVAGAGLPVAKHGNRAATSNSGSADVLSELGIEPAVEAATAERCLNEIGICFMFAPNFHRLSPTLGKVRRGLGFPTIFNCVGPLCNPASAPHQLIGVWSKEMVPKMAGALARLGTKRSWVVHGESGVDEVSLDGTTLIAEVQNDSTRTFEISPAGLSIEPRPLDLCRAGSAVESAALIRDVLAGRENSAARSMVLLNAATTIYLSGRVNDLSAGAAVAATSLESGAALAKLEALAAAVRS
ncbi:MAG: anthranilate phosphoribosyltransferase [Acidobacteria bacterium]|nr:anthranilate phosphoribosyltransferase [Acidobacteriota bacterium]